MSQTVQTVPMIHNERNQAYYEGSELLKIEGLSVLTYIHYGLKSIIGYKNKCKKAYINFRYEISEEAFARKVAQHKESLEIDARQQRELMTQRDALRQRIQVGDVFYVAWGYEQTNIDYYQVTKIRGRKFIFRKIKINKIPDRDKNGCNSMTGVAHPLPNEFADEQEMVKHFPRYGNFLMNNSSFLRPLDFKVDPDSGERTYMGRRYSSYA